MKLKSDDKYTVKKIEEEHNNIVKLLEDYNDYLMELEMLKTMKLNYT